MPRRTQQLMLTNLRETITEQMQKVHQVMTEGEKVWTSIMTQFMPNLRISYPEGIQANLPSDN